jgi:predicted GTPase
MGYSEAQLRAMATTIEDSDAEVVVVATPIDLAALIPITKPVVRARYEFAEDPAEPLSAIVDAFLRDRRAAR